VYLSVQYLRGFAALSVVVVHLEFQLRRLGYEGVWPRFPEGGVDLFFVISGFVISVASARHSGSVSEFLYRRAARVVPLYWLVTTAIVLLALTMPHVLQTTRFEAGHVVSSYLFLPYLVPETNLVYPFLIAGWTLNYEMFFYGLFAACLMAPQRIRCAVVCLLMISLVLCGEIARPQNVIARAWTDPILLEFMAGVVIAQTQRFLPASRAASLGFLGCAVAVWLLLNGIAPDAHRVLLLGLPASLLLISALVLERSGPVAYSPLARRLGDSSYALYLTHGIVLSAALQIWRMLRLGDSHFLLFATLSVLACVIVGFATWTMIDRPVQNWLRAKRMRFTAPVIATQRF
jgi:exopolysaccharide production protein ExoZ